MAALIPGATLVIMAGTGHVALFTKPGLIDQIVLDYLAGKTPAGAAGAAMPTTGTPTR
jgi:hypothetical protein